MRLLPIPLRPPARRWLALALLGAACSDAADRAAKARIFSPEEPATEVVRAREPIDPAALGTDAAAWNRVWKMDRREVTERIGAHKARSDVTFRWSRGGRAVSLKEEQKFETDAAGGFRARLTNDQDAGLEFVWAGGKAFARGRYGEFRPRRVDRAQHDAWRDQATAAPRTLWDLFGRRLRGVAAGTTTHAGRPARRYTLELGEPFGPEAPPEDLPPVMYGLVKDPSGEKLVPGPDADTGRRLEFEHRHVPERIVGQVLVDERTGVLLKVESKSRFTMPGEGALTAVLELELGYALEPAGSLVIEVPKGLEPPRLLHAVNKPLWFLGDEASQAGTDPAAEPREDEPD
jgi:hypothetical protein